MPPQNHSGVGLLTIVSIVLLCREKALALLRNPSILLHFHNTQIQISMHLSCPNHMSLQSHYFVTLLYLSNKTFFDSWREKDRICGPRARNIRSPPLPSLHVSTIPIYIYTAYLVCIHNTRIPIPHLDPQNRKFPESTCTRRCIRTGGLSSSTYISQGRRGVFS